MTEPGTSGTCSSTAGWRYKRRTPECGHHARLLWGVVKVRALADGVTHAGYFDDYKALVRAAAAPAAEEAAEESPGRKRMKRAAWPVPVPSPAKPFVAFDGPVASHRSRFRRFLAERFFCWLVILRRSTQRSSITARISTTAR